MNFKLSNKKLAEIVDFLIQIISLGDATRRCVSLAFQDSFDLFNFYKNCCEIDAGVADKLHSFFGSMSNDDTFRKFFTFSFVKDLPQFIIFNNENGLKNVPKDSRYGLKQIYSVTFHATTDLIVNELVKELKIKLSEILDISIINLFTFNFMQMSKEYTKNSDFYPSITRIFSLLKSLFDVYDHKSQEIMKFVHDIFAFFLTKEFSLPFSRVFGDKYDDPTQIQSSQFSLYFQIFHLIHKISSRCIYTKKPLLLISDFFKSPEFQSIDKDYEKKDENDSIYYHSVLLGVSIF